jgi:prepilin-type N-terminal cleavage/methylation domain-containing protein
MRKRSGPQGFTLLEVMVALTVFMVALTGMVALQKASLSAGSRGRQNTAAVSVARYFLTALQNEVMAWPVRYPTSSFSDSSYPLLNQALTAPNAWHPASVRVDEFLGHSTDDTPGYELCVTYMASPMGSALATPADALAWKLRVRVSWTRPGELNLVNAWTDCTVDAVAERLAAGGSDEAVELVTVATRGFAR